MGQPTPPGDMPLYEGLGSEWNDIVRGFPEDKRAEFAPLLKQRIDSYEPLKQWDQFAKSGVTPEHADTAINLFSVIENNPRQVYDTLGKYLGITPQEAKAAVKELENDTLTSSSDGSFDITSDPRFQSMQQQVETLAQIALAQRNQTTAEKQAAEQDAAVETEINSLKSKYGDVDEEEVLMRMLHKNMTAEQAYQEYTNKISMLKRRTPAPMLLGSGGAVPRNAIDPKKLDGQGTRQLVAQMMQHALDEGNK